MNGVHDMGGMHGFGPVEPEPLDAPPFHEPWEARARAMVRLMGDYFTVDAFRYGIEQMPPERYLETPYHGRWLASLEWNLVRAGVITEAELDAWMEFARNPAGQQVRPPVSPTAERPDTAVLVREKAGLPRFQIGDAVVTRIFNPTGHTRLPRYARGKRGTIDRVHPLEPLADISAHQPNAPHEHTYHVRFESSELWGEDAEPGGSVSLDLYESYLLPVR